MQALYFLVSIASLVLTNSFFVKKLSGSSLYYNQIYVHLREVSLRGFKAIGSFPKAF